MRGQRFLSFSDMICLSLSINSLPDKGLAFCMRFWSSCSLIGKGEENGRFIFFERLNKHHNESIYALSACCKRSATFSSRSPSSFETGCAKLLGEFKTFFRSSGVLASAKGLTLVAGRLVHFFSLSLISARVISPFLRRSSSSLVSGAGAFCSCFHTSSGSFSANGFLKLGGSPNEAFIDFNSDLLLLLNQYTSYSEMANQPNRFHLTKGRYSVKSSDREGLTASRVIIPSK